MKRLVQLFFFILLIIVCIYFYKNFLRIEKNNNDNDEKSLITKNITDQINENNFIQNLSYKLDLNGNRNYTIKAKESEILIQDNLEIVKMNFVIAEYKDKEKSPITITSNNATFNTSNYNSKFENNVKIVYSNHLIRANNVYIDFKDNIILIKDNVDYEGPLVSMESDVIKFDLVTKNISIFMDKESENISLESKK